MRRVLSFSIFLAVLFLATVGLTVCIKAALKTDIVFAPVPTGSMVPNITVGSLLILSGTNPEEVDVGDVIVFKTPSTQKHALLFIFTYYYPEPWVHRVIAKEVVGDQYFFLTKGDANPMPDQNPNDVTTWLKGEDVIGKVVFVIPYLGWVFLWAKSPIGTAIIVALIIVLAASWAWEESRPRN